ncbi:Uncharacterised protein [Vibrio cholerae]|nr:Uncharacterised protein [Vibrio cholerae]
MSINLTLRIDQHHLAQPHDFHRPSGRTNISRVSCADQYDFHAF